VSAQAPDGPPARVHAVAWGDDTVHERAAIDDLRGGRWPGADRFDWRSLNLLETGPPCLLDIDHPSILASNSGPGWVWALHDPSVPAPLVELTYEQDDGCPCVDGGETP
jgi:hypothetical protein